MKTHGLKEKEVRLLDTPIDVVTANGTITVKHTTTILVPQLNQELDFLVIPKCPMAIGMGQAITGQQLEPTLATWIWF